MASSSKGEGKRDEATNSGPPQKFWEFADLGFDTSKKLWFLQFFNELNQNVGAYYARDITLRKGDAFQYQWKDNQGKPFWHVRERFLFDDIEILSIDPSGMSIVVKFKDEPQVESSDDSPMRRNFSYLQYAFHLSSRDQKGGRAPKGFVEFFDDKGALVQRIDNRWIVVEGVERKTVGEAPKIRMRVERKEIENIVVTRSVIVIEGRR